MPCNAELVARSRARWAIPSVGPQGFVNASRRILLWATKQDGSMVETTGTTGGVAVLFALAALLGGTVAFVLRYRWNGRDRDWKVNLIIVLLVLISMAAAVPKG